MTSAEYAKQLFAAIQGLSASTKTLKATANALAARPRSVSQEIDEIPGRRALYTLSGETTFDVNDFAIRGAPVSMLIPQDRAFVMTHYPVISWSPSAPSNATNFGRMSPVRSWPTIDQQFGGFADMIDIGYELVDGGALRNLQDTTPVSGQLVSTSANLIPLPMPSLFAPNTSVQVYPTYNNIAFTAAVPGDHDVATTQGLLHVDLPGYCILL